MLVLPCLFVLQSSMTLSLPYFSFWDLVDVSTVSYCLNPVMLTYNPVKNCSYIVVSFQVIVSSRLLAHIQYMGHNFIDSLTHMAFGVLIYSKYLCLVILSVQSLDLGGGCYESFCL